MISYTSTAVCNTSKHQTIYYQLTAAILSHSNMTERSPTSFCSVHHRQYRVLHKLHVNEHCRGLGARLNMVTMGTRLNMGMTCPQLNLSHPPVRWPSLIDYDLSSLIPTPRPLPPPDTKSTVGIRYFLTLNKFCVCVSDFSSGERGL